MLLLLPQATVTVCCSLYSLLDMSVCSLHTSTSNSISLSGRIILVMVGSDFFLCMRHEAIPRFA